MPAQRLPILDGLRALAMLLVFFTHSAGREFLPTNHIGKLGVLLFFTLSGFLMAMLYMPGKLSLPYWIAFITRRSFKIYPTFFVIILLERYIDFFLPVEPRITNLWPLAFIDVHYQFWTIPVEVMFYMALPFYAVLLLLLPLKKQWKIALSMVLWLLMSIYTQIHFRRTEWQFFTLFLGGLNAGYVYKEYGDILSRYIKTWNVVAILCLAAIPWLTMWGYDSPNELKIALNSAKNFSPYLALLLLSCAFAKGPFFWPLTNRFMVYLGTISYSFYLIHAITLNTVQYYAPLYNMTGEQALLTSFIITFVLAMCLYYLIEKPFMRYGAAMARAIGNRYHVETRH